MSAQRRAAYRVQLRPGFGFAEVAQILPYLRRLGVTHLYTSPYLAAVPGSTHGYDIIDHRRVNAELGGEGGHDELRRRLREEGLAQLIDLVPNHMAIGRPENEWWWDVLENGRSSRYASYFDVDWDPPESKLRDTVLLPVLADHYGRVLEAGGLGLERDGGHFRIRYGEQTYPCSPRALDRLLADAGLDDLAIEASSLPFSDQDDAASIADRHARKERLAREIRERCTEVDVAGDLDAAVARINADHDALDDLLSRQNYRLAYWRVASQELDYRRFFDITGLVALRIEREHVFRDSHKLVLGWAREGHLDGIRVDHPDGLRDPEEYFERLAVGAPGTWLLAEKILQRGEELPVSWPVQGTTGYDFAALASGLFVDPQAEEGLTGLYAEVSGERRSYAEVLYEAKHDVVRTSLAADLERLTVFFVRVCEGRRRYRDYTRADLREVLRETVACFPVYRSYVRAEQGTVPPADEPAIATALEAAGRRRPDLDPELFGLLGDILSLRLTGPNETGLVMRLQQYTAPVTAKGAEDTAFYRYARLVCLNEVGGDPGTFGTTPAAFHEHNARIQKLWPNTLLTTSTHDTKRSEDVRMRIALLSQDRHGWPAAVRRWRRLAVAHHTDGLPGGEMEYLIYQTLVGAYPLDPDRLLAYAEKAAREAKRETSWARPDERYESALRRFASSVLADPALMSDISAYAQALVAPARSASLSLTLLRLTSPGIPDLYQGNELWDLSLVDPDNRRPVDFALRARLLGEVERLDAAAVQERADEGLPKLFLIQRALELRARHADAFVGPYRPLWPAGGRADDLVAYSRADRIVAIAPRFLLGRADWADTTLTLPSGRWRDALSGAMHDGSAVPVHRLLGGFPVALLERI